MIWPNFGLLVLPSLSAKMTILASPSIVASKILISFANKTALLHAKVSTVAIEHGRGILSTKAPITIPSESWITTPKPATPKSLKIAPLKFTLYVKGLGGIHLVLLPEFEGCTCRVSCAEEKHVKRLKPLLKWFKGRRSSPPHDQNSSFPKSSTRSQLLD
ncbi:hypothetical protein ACB092_10G028500 [Castanea dentata]